ncbi:MAG: TIGR02186 family protein [bacterium]|nr:TIGR02186 family protein [bacterium]
MPMRIRVRPVGVCLLAFGLLAVTLSAPVAQERGGDGFRIQPTDIEVGIFFSGASVRIDAPVPMDYDIVVACEGKARPLTLKRRGKVAGVLWMSVAEITFDQIPPLYHVSSTRDLAALAPAATLAEWGFGYPVLKARNSETNSDTEPYFGELVKLKESEGLYSVLSGEVTVSPQSGGGGRASVVCKLPAKTPPGDYVVRLVGFRDGRGELLGSGTVSVREAGFVAFITKLAREHGLLYGLLAVGVALGVGLLTGRLFGRSSKRGH